MADNDITTGATFADLPDVRINANGEQYVAVPTPPEPPPPAQAQAPQVVQIPVPVPMPNQPESDADFLRKLALARGAAEQEANQRLQRESWSRVATPPALPDDDDALADPKTVKDILRKQAEWTRNLVAENAKVLGATVSQLNEEAEQSRLTRAELAAERARASLLNQGFNDVDAYWGPVEDMLRRDSNNYWKIRTNPAALETAVKIVRDHMIRSGQNVPMQAPAPPVSAPYGNVNSAPVQQQQQQGLDPSMSRVAKTLGITWKPEDFARRRIVR